MATKARQVFDAWRQWLKQQHIKRRLLQVVTSRRRLQTQLEVWAIWRDEYVFASHIGIGIHCAPEVDPPS